MRRDVLTWEKSHEVWRDVMKELSPAIETMIRSLIAAGRASPCCLCAFRKMRNKYDREVWPERLEKILLKQTRARKSGKVSSRHR